MDNRPSWDEFFMAITKITSIRSTCNSRHNGCVIVRDKSILSAGFNGALQGCKHCSDYFNKDNKPVCVRRDMNVPDADKQLYCVASHAESNAVALAAEKGISLHNSTAYCTISPCYNCLKTMVRAGIKEIVYEFEYQSKNKKRDEYWKSQIINAGINFRQVWLKDNTVNLIKEALEFPTGKRRLDATD